MTDDTLRASDDALLYLADTNLAAGLRYGLWVERSPSVEEQVALSSMSQDKLGHARAFNQLAQEATGRSQVELQYQRDPAAFTWNPAWIAPIPSWDHFVLAQSLFSRALLLEIEAFSPAVSVQDLRAKIEQEESWHTQHGDAWLARSAKASTEPGIQAALDDLWPAAVAFFGAAGEERFPDDVDRGSRARSDDELRQAFLGEVVPRLRDLGLKVPAREEDGRWITDPESTAEFVADVRDQVEEMSLELVAMLQDPAGRELAEL